MKKATDYLIGIVLVSYNLGRMTQNCIESIKKNVTLPYEVLLVDNGSEEETVHILDEIKGSRLI